MLRALLVCALVALAAAKEESSLEQFAGLSRRRQAVRPVTEFADQLKTTVGLTLIDVDVDDAGSAATLSGWLQLQWENPAFVWPAGEVNHTRVHPSDIWVPDVLPYNSHLPAGEGWLRETLAIVYPSGQTLWVPPFTLRVRCRRSVSAAKDRVTCPVKLGSWTYSEQEMDLLLASDTVDTSNFSANGRWAVDSASVKREEKKYDCCPEKYVSLNIQLVLKPQRA